MKWFIFLSIIVLVSARIINKNDCEGIVVDGISHAKEIIKEYIEMPYQLAMDYNNNVLYFSYIKNGTNKFFPGYIDLKTNEFGTISGVKEGSANAVDEKTHTVYFGGMDGIYKLKDSIYPETSQATNLNVTDKNIWQLFSKDGLYFTTFSEQKAYLYKDGEVKKVTEIGNTRIMLIGVDNSHNIIFSNMSGLFYHTKSNGETGYVGNYILNAITSDMNGKIFFSTSTEIYSVDGKKKEVKRLATFDDIDGVAIGRDGSIIYSSDNSIIRLKSTEKDCVSELDAHFDSSIDIR